MIIFIDTNILFNNWYLKNANFSLLFNFIENTNSTLWISEIVVDEIENKFKTEKFELDSKLKCLDKKIFNLYDNKSLKCIDLPELEYSLKGIIQERTNHVFFYDYSEIDNKCLVDRAIQKTKPFQSEDKGFRDSLIWLSFLLNIKKRGVKDNIIFISNNSSDFFNKDKNDFHQDLKTDLKIAEIKNEYSIFTNLYSFVQKTIDRSKHTYSIDEIYDKYIYEQEYKIEREILEIIKAKNKIEFVKHFSRNSTLEKIIINVTDYNFKIIEGIEDVSLENYQILNNSNEIYVELNLDFRISEIEYTLPQIFYHDYSDYIDKEFYNLENLEGEVRFYDFQRIDFNVSYTLNTENEEIQNLTINKITIRR